MSFIRELNHWRIDSSKALLLKIIRGLYDHPRTPTLASNSPNLAKVKKILVLHFDDKIGDLVVNSSIFRELKTHAPQASIDLVSGRNASPLVHHCPHINNIILFKKGLFPTLKLPRKLVQNQYDLVIDLRLMTDSRTIYILSKLGQNPNTLRVGLNKSHHCIYDLIADRDFRSIHAKERVGTLLSAIGIKSPNLKYDLHFSKDDLELTKTALEKKKITQFIILNPFAGARFRSFQFESVKRIEKLVHQKHPNLPILVTGSPNDQDFLNRCMNELSHIYYLPEVTTLSALSAIVSLSSGVISPDTSLVHIASAFDKNIIAFFRDDSGDLERNSLQWAPTSTHSSVILCNGRTNGYLDVNTFNDDDFVNALSGFYQA